MDSGYPFLTVLDEEGILYCFNTDNYAYTSYFNNRVYADLIVSYHFLSSYSYSFGFFKRAVDEEDVKNKTRDERVSITIGTIIEDFMVNNGQDTIILFHCDSHDQRQGSRHRAFLNWYRNSEANKIIHLHTKEIPVADIKHYLDFLCFKNNPHIEKIEREFETSATNLTKVNFLYK